MAHSDELLQVSMDFSEWKGKLPVLRPQMGFAGCALFRIDKYTLTQPVSSLNKEDFTLGLRPMLEVVAQPRLSIQSV